MEKSTLEQAQRRRVILSAVAAFVLYGGWAILANYDHGLTKAFTAGLTQGLMSMVSTAFLTAGMEWIFAACSAGALRYFTTGLTPITLVLVIMTALHLAIGTPEVLVTMLPSAIIGIAYSMVYATGLTRTQRDLAAGSAVAPAAD